MKKIIYILFVFFYFCLFTFHLFAQSITWQRSYGNSHINEGYSIVQTPDNGYLAVSRDRISIDEKIWLLRLNEYGDTLWTKFLGNDIPVKIIKTNDNNYLIVGAFTNIFKININGDILWRKGPYDYTKIFKAVKQTFDGGYIICGWKEAGNIVHPYLFKINSTGDSLWELTYTNGIFDGRFYDLTITNDDNFVMTGNLSDSAYITDKLFLMKTDNFGNQIWLRRYDALMYFISLSISNTFNGSFLVAGQNGNNNRPYYAKLDSLGHLTWLKIYSQSNNLGRLLSAIETNDKCYAFTGRWDTLGNSTDFVLLLKTDTSGAELWHRSFGFNNEDLGNEVKQTSDSGYIVIGKRGYYQNDDAYIIKSDKFGYSSPIGITPISNTMPNKYEFYPIMPNPTNPGFILMFEIPYNSNVKVTIYDVLGRELEIPVNENLALGSYNIKLNLTNLSSGIYFVRFLAASLDAYNRSSYMQSQKLILIK